MFCSRWAKFIKAAHKCGTVSNARGEGSVARATRRKCICKGSCSSPSRSLWDAKLCKCKLQGLVHAKLNLLKLHTSAALLAMRGAREM
jgi:hypothetical protein